MGSLNALAKRPMSPARARLVNAIQAARYGLKEVSALLGRNPSYLQQYIVKGSPRHLPEAVRLQLAELLGVPEADLRETAGEGSSTVTGARAASPSVVAQVPGLTLPVMLDSEALAGTSRRTTSLGELTAGISEGCVAIALTAPQGALQPRSIVVCDPAGPVAIGDLAMALPAEGEPVMGLASPSPRGSATILAQGDSHTYPAATTRLWRVLAILPN